MVGGKGGKRRREKREGGEGGRRGREEREGGEGGRRGREERKERKERKERWKCIAFSYVLEFVEAVGNGSGAVETTWQREGGDGESVEV